MDDPGNWCLVESDPAVFTELMQGFGVNGLECEEVFDMSDLSQVKDALGFIFLFKFEEKSQTDGQLIKADEMGNIFFAKQMIRNACATQAIINVLLNADQKKVNLGETLTDFKTFVIDFDPSLKGTALSNSEKIKEVHNSFSSSTYFNIDSKITDPDEDVYHFVGYVPIDGVIYELDGLKTAPIKHSEIANDSNWVDTVQPIIDKRMKKCIDGNFNLMAIVPDRILALEKEIVQAKTNGIPNINEMETNLLSLKLARANQKMENIRRKHNYFPLIMEIMKLLAKEGKLVSLVNAAMEKEKPKMEASKS
ncbi:ubiquitin carboxyl-terminal hydrolase [Cichlidogyrus casuarinus]|uniref:Ubiquitin carboxyl-terminal hydrolase n=1 Tax=Cichlidogyrus casuarinus TaxID=1844966 RepID=A0ABD2PZ71_9PLAT